MFTVMGGCKNFCESTRAWYFCDFLPRLFPPRCLRDAIDPEALALGLGRLACPVICTTLEGGKRGEFLAGSSGSRSAGSHGSWRRWRGWDAADLCSLLGGFSAGFPAEGSLESPDPCRPEGKRAPAMFAGRRRAPFSLPRACHRSWSSHGGGRRRRREAGGGRRRRREGAALFVACQQPLETSLHV